MSWSIICVKVAGGKVAPLAKTKRDVSTKELRRICRKFRNDGDYQGEALLPDWRLGLTQIEMKKIPTVS